MLILSLGLMMTVVLLASAGYWNKHHAAELGWMSEQWVAAHIAAQPASSI